MSFKTLNDPLNDKKGVGSPAALPGRPPQDGSTTVSEPKDDNTGGAADLALAVAEKFYKGGHFLYFYGDVEQIIPVLEEWLDPARRLQDSTGRDPVMDALSAARFLEYGDIHRVAPSLMPWLYYGRYRGRVVELLGHLDHVGIQRIVVPWVRTRLTTSTGGPGPSDYRVSAEVLDHLGLYDQARWVADQALAHEDPQIQQAGHDIRQQLPTTPGNRTE